LLGARLVVGNAANQVVVRLTEVEAYEGTRDPGSHAFRGPTPRNAVMFGPPGHLYVYFSYGMHWCANVVCGPDGVASAVLLRAGEVVAGRDLARERRGPRSREVDLARGPARLTRCLGLDRRWNGRDLCAPGAELRIEHDGAALSPALRCGPRVGVSGPGGDGREYPWRFWIEGEPTVSPYRPGRPRRPATTASEQVGDR
jgi:DNA-3-methyladenine glycosylase